MSLLHLFLGLYIFLLVVGTHFVCAIEDNWSALVGLIIWLLVLRDGARINVVTFPWEPSDNIHDDVCQETSYKTYYYGPIPSLPFHCCRYRTVWLTVSVCSCLSSTAWSEKLSQVRIWLLIFFWHFAKKPFPEGWYWDVYKVNNHLRTTININEL